MLSVMTHLSTVPKVETLFVVENNNKLLDLLKLLICAEF